MPKAYLIPICMYLCSCALPAAKREQQDFIPDQEISIIEYVNNGLSYFQKGRFSEAEARFRKALYLAPGTANILLNLALTLEQLGQYEEADEILKGLIGQYPQVYKYQFARAHLYLSMEDYPQAIQTYERIYQNSLDDEFPAFATSAARSLATLHFELGNEEQARCYSTLAQISTANLEQRVRHARILLASSFYDELILAYRVDELLQTEGGKADLLVELAMALFANGDIEKAKLLSLRAHQLPFEDATLRADLDLLDAVIRKLHPEDSSEDSEEDPQILEEQLEQELLLFEIDYFANPASIYWPAPLLAAIAKIKSDLFPEEEGEA